MTNPGQQPGPRYPPGGGYRPPGSVVPGTAPPPGQPYPGHGQGGWPPQYGAPYAAQPYAAQPYAGQPYAAPDGGYGPPAGYPAAPKGSTRRRAPLAWVFACAAVMAVVVVAAVLVIAGGDGSTGGPRSTAQAYADAINARKPDRGIYCDSFLDRVEDAAAGLPGLSELPGLSGLPDLGDLAGITLSASVGDVTRDGDSASAQVTILTELAGQRAVATQTLSLQRTGGAWKICGIDFSRPRLGG